jgi:acyl phosphate:glycerol-3-phosphate acyltransferase
MKIVVLAVFSYLYGSIPFAYLATRLITGKKLTEEGTGNIGVTNAYKVGGMAVVIITLLGEISKAVFSIYASRYVSGDDLFAMLLCAFCALVGTSFSVFLRGRGGRGSTVGLWIILILSPLSGVILLAIASILAALARVHIMIKKLLLLCIPMVIYLVERDPVFTAFGMLTSLLFLLTGYIRKDDYAYYNVFHQRSGL